MSTLLPVFVLIRARNPTRRFWINRLAPAIVGLGPQRIWAPTPASAGCAVIDVLGTTSADSAVAAAGSRASGLVVGRNVVFDVGNEGRRLGRKEKDLRRRKRLENIRDTNGTDKTVGGWGDLP